MIVERRQLPARRLLTVEQAASRLCVSRTRFYQLLAAGEVESVLIGRLRRVPETAVQDYIQRLRRDVGRRSSRSGRGRLGRLEG